jgi:tetraacyldisaccharide 4'-kinase
LPAGPLREPPDQVQRADAVVLTRCPNPDPPGKAEVEQRLDGQPIFMTDHQPQALVDLETGQRLAAEHLRGRTVIGFCGLARPEVFLKTLQDLGAVVPAFVRWPDHHHPNDDDLKLIQAKAREVGAKEAVTTAKDAVKLAGRLADYRPRVWVLEVAPVFLKDEEAFWDLVLPETSRHAR